MSAPALSLEDAPVDRRRTLPAVAGVLALALAGAAAAWWWQQAHWPVAAVRIDGPVAHVDREDMKAVIARHTRAGFFALDLGALRQDLLALEWVRAASLRRVWPDTLRVEVREHEPAATWNGDALVSTRGAVFDPGAAAIEGLPALTGPEGQGGAMLERLDGFARRLAPLDLEPAALHQDARRSWRLELANGIELRLGRERVDARLARFVAVWPGVLAPQAERIAAVDLRYPNGFTIAWREAAATDSPEGGA